MEENKTNDSKKGSSFLGLAAALSCGGAVLVGLIWLVFMCFCYREHEEESYRGLVLTTFFTALCAFLEVPLLTVWGVCADRKNKIALNLANPKKDSAFLILAGCLSFACFIGILFFSLEALFWSFGKQWSHALEIIESGMASFTYLPFLIAPIAVPVLFIRNIYAHIKWRKVQNRR